MLLVFVETTELTPEKLLVRKPTPALNVNNEVLMPGMLSVVVRR